MLFSDSDAVILYGELNLAIECIADIDNHVSALVIVADCVVTEVVEHLVHHGLVGVNVCRCSEKHELDVVFVGGNLEILNTVLRRLV